MPPTVRRLMLKMATLSACGPQNFLRRGGTGPPGPPQTRYARQFSSGAEFSSSAKAGQSCSESKKSAIYTTQAHTDT